MRERTFHYVTGVGKQIPSNPDTEFNPQTFERAIHGLQRLILRASDYHNEEDVDTPGHTYDTNENGNSTITVEDDSALATAIDCSPYKWDVSIVKDANENYDHSFAVRTSVDCGGSMLVYATIFVRNGWLARLDIGHTTLGNPEETVEAESVFGTCGTLDLIQYLERETLKGYAKTIQSAATAFDYIATKDTHTASGNRGGRLPRNFRSSSPQHDWAEIREKTPQTISNNVSSAREDLLDIPDSTAFDAINPTLTELDPDADDKGDIRLV